MRQFPAVTIHVTIYCVFDRDSHESFQRACDKISELASRATKPLPIKGATSLPCFEVWVLLHFDQSDAPYASCDAVIDRITAQHYPELQKSRCWRVAPTRSKARHRARECALARSPPGHCRWKSEHVCSRACRAPEGPLRGPALRGLPSAAGPSQVSRGRLMTSDPSTIQNCLEGSISLKLAGIFYNESPKSLILFNSTQDS
jgi:hypothetical protein